MRVSQRQLTIIVQDFPDRERRSGMGFIGIGDFSVEEIRTIAVALNQLQLQLSMERSILVNEIFNEKEQNAKQQTNRS